MDVLHVKWKWTIPNILSLLRIALLPAFAVLYLKSAERPSLLWWAGGVLALSGLTDLLDGKIARRFHQVSDAGKLLDPLADKLTQLTVLVCLATRYTPLWWLLGVCFVKEVLQIVGGALLLRRGEKVHGSQWFGKVATAVFYGSMAAFIAFPAMPVWLQAALIVLVGVLMLIAFFGYLKTYLDARRSPDDGRFDNKE